MNIHSLIQIEKSSWCVMLIVVSDDYEYLNGIIQLATSNDLLVWPTRLLVVSSLPIQFLRPLEQWLSAINAMVIAVEGTTFSEAKRSSVYMYIPYSHRRVLVASWSPMFGLTYNDNYRLFPNKFQRLADGANMTVVGNNFPLHVIISKIETEDGKTEFSFQGPLVKVLEMLSAKMNFRYNLIQPSDGGWGVLFPNGSWNGMIGMMIRKEVDFGLGPFGVTYIRSKVIDYTDPLIMDYGRILGRRGDTEVDPWGFLMPLTPTVWAAFLASFLLILFLAKVASRIDWNLRELSPKIPVATYVRVLFQQDPIVPYNSGWEKMLLGGWLLAVLVIIECYSTNLTSLLAVRYIAEPYQSMRILLDDPKAKMVWVANTAYAQILADVDSGIFYEAKQTAKDGRIRYIKAPEYITAVDNLVSRGDHVLINPLIIMKIFLTESYMEKGNCKFYVSKETFLPQTFCMVVPRNSPLRHPINQGIRTVVEGGLYNYWLDNVIPNAKSCKNPPTKITVKASLTFRNLWGVFAVLVAGYIISFIMLCVEIAVSKTNQLQKTH
ncbi:glutamate receptor ionotropic, delta-2-like [Palaemon carinicauda]|uniref:glutamate receptor ionotropic, delta-2-like n=1 Tax=Palaemon carinicauda TaxID=392227 RepID=UPI0035B63B4F